jgi:cytochrome bd ubiquinol oxidase subunit I
VVIGHAPHARRPAAARHHLLGMMRRPWAAARLTVMASTLEAARSQMAFTLGFHIVLASLGVGFPAMMLIANYRGLRHDDAQALLLARRWSQVVAVTFAVGAVTGTVLSFEFGLLWPAFTGRFGQVFGVLFAIEGIFFFLEAIFVAVYIFGWKRLKPWTHFWAGVPVVICGLGGAFSVVAVNSWMNQPQGFSPTTGQVTSVSPLKVIFNPAVPYEVPHMILAAYLVTGFLVASIYAVGMLRGRRDHYHRLGLLIPLTVALIAAPIQFAVGDTAARAIAADQPIKFAGMECVQQTATHVTEYIYGRCTPQGVKGGIGIPGFDSFLVGFSTDTQVIGLDSVPADQRPPANTMLHWAFDTMVGICSAMIALGLWLGIVWWRKRDIPRTPWFLRAVAVSGVAAIVALECGWIVTEVGRQPWVVYKIMRTSDAVTHASGVWVTFAIIVGLYAVLGVALVVVVRAMARRWRAEGGDEAADVPYGPPAERPFEVA